MALTKLLKEGYFTRRTTKQALDSLYQSLADYSIVSEGSKDLDLLSLRQQNCQLYLPEISTHIDFLINVKPTAERTPEREALISLNVIATLPQKYETDFQEVRSIFEKAGFTKMNI